ncbi:MAG: amidohydrolase family protein [Kouleothrix sp.]|jgi:5-methylthioadenosine/S-adenosylhomocysteine deaminase|nr:amidohydrolase family protein [Kouleothrix sp.]
MPDQADLLLVNGVVVTMDASWSVFERGAVAVRGRDIIAVGPAEQLAARYQAAEVVDCAGCAIMPGLINAHTHIPMSLLRGLVADIQLDVWLFGYMFPVESTFVDPNFSYVGSLLSCAEMIRGGTTTFCDMYYFEDQVARAADETGMRAICSQTVMRMPTPDAASYEEGLSRARRFVAEWRDHGRVIATIAPHAPYTCTDEIYREAVALCREYGVPLVTHLSETAREVVESRQQRGMTPIAYAQAMGAFDVHCIGAHCIHATEDDILLLQHHGAGAVPCPSSNLKLASGVGPYQRFIAAGVKTGLGTDGPASNDDQDMWTEIHLAALLPKGLSGDPTVVPAREALALATCRGAQAIGLEQLVGSLEPGKRADITVIELGQLHSAPRYRYASDVIYSYLVYTARNTDVRHTLVDGRFLLRDHALLTVDQASVLARAQAIADQIDSFLAQREDNLLSKIVAISGVHSAEIFEVQVKARVEHIEQVLAQLGDPAITITKASQRTQYDTYFSFADPRRGRIRLREDHRSDPGARPEPKYTITLTEPAVHGEYPHAIVISRARYDALADRTLRFYREYFQPDQITAIEKHRRRWRILYQGKDFAVNIDELHNHPTPGPYIEIKSRTWSRRDAAEKADLIGDLLRRFGIDESVLIKHEYAEM